MKLDTTGKKVIEEVPYGTYIWRMNDGSYLVDDEYRHLSIFCMKGDLRAIQALTNEAKNLGFGDGEPEWQSGVRKVSDEEYEMQGERQKEGLIADPLDFAAISEHIRDTRND